HVIDAAVKELAKQTKASILVIDPAHIAAGEWGDFGDVAAGLEQKYDLPYGLTTQERLARSQTKPKSSRRTENSLCMWCKDIPPPPKSLKEPSSSSSSDEGICGDPDCSICNSDKKKASRQSTTGAHAHCQLRYLLRLIISSEPPAQDPARDGSSICTSSEPASRIIYIRDLSIAANWARELLLALAWETSPHGSPIRPVTSAIVWGLMPKPPLSYAHASPNFPFGIPETNLSASCRTGNCSLAQDQPENIIEGEHANSLRQDRLTSRLFDWRNNILVEQETEGLRLDKEWLHESQSVVFPAQQFSIVIRSCVLMPADRNLDREKAERDSLRQWINRLRLRRAFGSLGLSLEDASCDTEGAHPMMKQLQIGIIDASTLSQVVDRAVSMRVRDPTSSIPCCVMPWDVLRLAWAAYGVYQDEKFAWIQSQTMSTEIAGSNTDPIVQRVKKMLLEPDERALLRCLVNPVSLPLLYPAPFQCGFLKNNSLGGALLFGPPGTGKTLVAQAIAKDSGARMLVIKPTDVVDKCNGHSEKLVENLFKLARRLKPCLIFMDEIDGLLGTRIYQKESNSGHWDARMLTQFMQEMDGLAKSDVLVIGTTNRPFALDEAIVRRLPHRIMIDLPKKRARKAILTILLRDEVLAPDVDLWEISRKTRGFSGSDLRGLCVSAALAAAKQKLNLPWKTGYALCEEKSPEERCSNTHGSDACREELAVRQVAQIAPINTIGNTCPMPESSMQVPGQEKDTLPCPTIAGVGSHSV
ncbi:unnamed protein product, partial [Rhizoctonia solani]